MPTPIAGYGIIVVKISTPIVGRFATWGFMFKQNAGWSLANFDAWLIGTGAAQLRGNMYSAYGITSYDVYTVGALTTVTKNLAGASATSTLMPPGLAHIIKKTTGLPGHSQRGRMYIPGILAEGDVANDGTISPTIMAIRTTTFNTLLTTLAAGNTPMYLQHRSGAAPTLVTALTPLNVVGSQRRRQRP
jgi:hypothetical protein